MEEYVSPSNAIRDCSGKTQCDLWLMIGTVEVENSIDSNGRKTMK